MSMAHQWYQQAPSGTLDLASPATAARLRDLGDGCNTLAIAVARVTVEIEATQMRLHRLVDDDDALSDPPQQRATAAATSPYLRQAEEMTVRCALREAASLTAVLTQLAITFAVHGNDALVRLLRRDRLDAAPPSPPAPSAFLRSPQRYLPDIGDLLGHVAAVDRQALQAAHRRLLTAAGQCATEDIEKFDDPMVAPPGLPDALAVAAHSYARHLVDACRTAPT